MQRARATRISLLISLWQACPEGDNIFLPLDSSSLLPGQMRDAHNPDYCHDERACVVVTCDSGANVRAIISTRSMSYFKVGAQSRIERGGRGQPIVCEMSGGVPECPPPLSSSSIRSWQLVVGVPRASSMTREKRAPVVSYSSLAFS